MLRRSSAQPSQRHTDTCSARSSSCGSKPPGEAGTEPDVSDDTSDSMSVSLGECDDDVLDARRRFAGDRAGDDGEE